MKSILLILLLLLINGHAHAQDWLLGSSSNFNNEAFDVKKDAQGNSIITGYFSGQTNFQGTILQSQSGSSDIYVVKINSTGNVVWAKSFGGAQADRGMKLAIDNADNIYVTGYFLGTMAMGATTLTSNSNSRDFFLAKLNPSGDVIWARSDGGNMGETAYDITVDSQNNCIVTGQFEGTTQIGGASFVSQWNPVDNVPSFDIFVAKFSAAGLPLWVKNGMSEYEDRGIAVTCDASDNIYVTGQFSDTMVFLGQIVNNQIYNAGFVAKISPTGSSLWFRRLAAAQTLAYDIELNALGEVYITGDFLGTMSFWDNAGLHQISNPYSKKVFAMKLTNSGEYIWGKAHGSDSEVSSRALLVDAAQDVYIGGYFKCNFDQYRDSTSTGLWTSAGFRDIFMTKLSPAGAMIWNKHSGGKKDDMCYALAPGNNDEPVFAGSFVNHLNIPTTSYALTNYDQNGSVDYESQTFNFYEVQGDESKNSFVGKVIKTSTPPLFYYYNTQYDSIPPDLTPAVDTLEGCAPLILNFNTKTNAPTGPGYDIHWSNGSQANGYAVGANHPEGMVYVEAERWDGCSSFKDSIYVIPHPAPPMPLLSDDQGYNTNEPVTYNTIKLCYPDTAQVWLTNLCVNCTAVINGPNGSYSYTGTGPFPVWENGMHGVVVTNEFGCTSTSNFNVQVFYLNPPDTMVLDLVFNDPPDWNDSITVCQGQPVNLVATDLLTNPSGNYTPYNHPYADEEYSAVNFASGNYPYVFTGGNNNHQGTFVPNATGWYVIRYDAWLGTTNMCGIDTTHFYVIDSVYVVVNPTPSMINPTLTSDGPICPGELVHLTTSATYTGFSWSGTAITWTSADGDSIQLTQPGQYSYHGSYTDPVTGCSASASTSINITEKSPPPIIMQPLDGIVCPFDSVHLEIYQPGIYEWIGPEGSLGSGADIYVTEQGFYHCVFTDPAGCTMTTQQVEIKEYTSPYLEFTPGNSLCITGEVEITAVYDGDAIIQWIAPLSGSGNSVTVNTPGTYYCQIMQCGFTVIDSVVITESTFIATLTASDTMLCYGEEITLSTISGMAQYEWLGSQSAGSSITVSSPGDYQVTVTNSDGCMSTSQVVHIGSYNGSAPPAINDVEICYGADAVLTDNSTYTTLWYSDTTSALPEYTGSTLSIPDVTSDTVVYVAYQNASCPLAFEAVVINVNEPLLPPAINGSLSLCVGVELQLTTDTISGVQYSWTYNGNTLSTTTTFSLSESQFVAGEMVYLTISNLCSSASDSASIILVPRDTLSLNIDSLIVCAGMEHLFFPDPVFAGEIHWQNGANNFEQDTLSMTLDEVTDPMLIAYGVDRGGCITVADTIMLYNPALTFVDIESSGVPCFGASVTLEGESDVSDVTWITSSGDSLTDAILVIPVLNYATDGWYYLHAVDAVSGCELTDSIKITPIPLPVFNIPDTILCIENLLEIEAPTHPSWTFSWNNPDSLLSITPDSSGTFLITATTLQGCTYTDSVTVTFVNCEPQAVNVITANGDGINDFFVVPNSQYMYGNYFIVINRWGNVVYETPDYRNQFDGGDLTEGVYFYRFFPKGKDKPELAIEGFFHIIR